MKKIIGAQFIIGLIVLVTISFFAPQIFTGSVVEGESTGKVVNSPKNSAANVAQEKRAITASDIAHLLTSSNIVADFPKNTVGKIELFNYASGNKAISSVFSVQKNSVTVGNPDNPVVTIYMHDKYISHLFEQNNLCATLRKAKSTGDLAYDTQLSATKLAWRFKGMTKYRKCMG